MLPTRRIGSPPVTDVTSLILARVTHVQCGNQPVLTTQSSRMPRSVHWRTWPNRTFCFREECARGSRTNGCRVRMVVELVECWRFEVLRRSVVLVAALSGLVVLSPTARADAPA